MTAAGLVLPGVVGNYASTPDNAALDIASDIDIRVDVTLSTWNPVSTLTLLAKSATGGQTSYVFLLEPTGILRLRWSLDGTNTNSEVSTLPVPVMQKPGQFSASSYRAPTQARLAVRATIDFTGGTAYSVNFWTAPSIAGPWTQLGASINNTSAVNGIFNSTSILEVGSNNTGTTGAVAPATFHAVEVRNGVDGTVVANPNFWLQPTGTTSFTDGAGRVWTVNTTNISAPATIVKGTPSYGLPFQIASDRPCDADTSFCAARDLIVAEFAVNDAIIARTQPARPCAIMTLQTPVSLPALNPASALLPLSFDTIEFDNDRMIDFDRSNQFIRPSRPGVYEVVAWAQLGPGTFNEEVDFYIMTGFSGPNLFGTGGGHFSGFAQDSFLVGGSPVWMKSNVLAVFDASSVTDVRVPGYGILFDGNTTTVNSVLAARLAVYWRRDPP